LTLGPLWPELRILAETGSTNDDLKALARAGAAEWTALLARRQTAGRGRLGREWVSLEGNLFLSVLVRPEVKFAPLLSILGGLAVAEALEGFQVAACLKWPNDVLSGEGKIAGILAEGLSTGERLEAVVIGFGVNLALEPECLPGGLGIPATSVFRETGERPDALVAAEAVLTRFRLWYDALREKGEEAVLAAFRERSIHWWGKPVELTSGGERFTGLARDLDPRGALVLELEDGTRRAFLSGEASLRPMTR
jgi:BirA family biotin operon repressor/biotin-[acetyl-CoA-carboxylase] ligase